MARVSMTPELTKDIIDRYQRGQSSKHIAFAHSIGPERVTRVLKEAGIKMRGPVTYKAKHNAMYPRRYHRKDVVAA